MTPFTNLPDRKVAYGDLCQMQIPSLRRRAQVEALMGRPASHRLRSAAHDSTVSVKSLSAPGHLWSPVCP